MLFPRRGSTDKAGAGKSFLYLRIDDRLIHGQVVIGWGEGLKLNCLILANDRIAANPAETEFYQQIIPAAQRGQILSVSEAGRQSSHLRSPGIRAMIVVASIAEALQWLEKAELPDLIILGGLRAGEHRIRLLDYLYLLPQEMDSLLAVTQRGLKVVCQDLPTSEAVPLEKLITTHSH